MACKQIVVLAGGAPGEDDNALAVAAWLAVEGQGRVRVLPAFADASADLMALGEAVGAPVPAPAVAALEEAGRDLQDRITASSRRAAEAADIPFGPGPGAPRLEVEAHECAAWLAEPRAAVLADLVVIGQAFLDRPGSGAAGLLDEALLRIRTPVLVVRGDPASLTGPAVIAWDGSVEASHAVKGALPLLGLAERTVVLQHSASLDAMDDAPAPSVLLGYLDLHELGGAEVIHVEGATVGKALLDALGALGAGLVVAGAYEHSRLREAIFGGATRALLKASRGPSLLLAH